MRLKPVKIVRRNGKAFKKALSYRMPMEVTDVRLHGQSDGYPVCPRCDKTVEREFMCFCDRCGQRLDWRRFPSD